MTIEEAILSRHSVRRYKAVSIPDQVVQSLHKYINKFNKQGQLHIQLVTNESKAFSRFASYGKFTGVSNYIVMAGTKSDNLDEKIGYYGEKLVLIAQTMGLNTCWAGMTYKKVSSAYQLADGEKIACMIALGYGETQGMQHRSKDISQVSNCTEHSPVWFRKGIESSLLAPTAVNQQKFRFLLTDETIGGYPVVKAQRLFSIVGYTQMDLGIAKLHFEIGAGQENFVWHDATSDK